AGAGRVFFISTVGSVAGVLVTAFAFIPNMTNFRAVLALGLGLCCAAAIYALIAPGLLPATKRKLVLWCVIIGVLAAGLFGAKDIYLKRIAAAGDDELVFTVRAELTSVFGNLKVVDVKSAVAAGDAQRFFLQDGLIQNRTTLEYTSISMYTYALEILARNFVPKAERAVVLGLGAGVVAKGLKRAGLRVSAIEINSDVVAAAKSHFGFDGAGIDIKIQDARTFARRCSNQYDIVVVDLFLGDNIPDYLLTRQFFADLRRCVRPGGAVVMNAFFDDEDEEPNRRMRATLKSAFPAVVQFGDASGNVFLVGATGPMPKDISEREIESARVPYQIRPSLDSVLVRKRVISEKFSPRDAIGDENNIFSVLFAAANMRGRQVMAGRLPPWVLVN
ncbi:MAG: fused MFS/spermidine synthase, partial [Rhodospirillales bacterium]|nr:fused MFS/spermidine synthase [Rhodospirillales bacterium]